MMYETYILTLAGILALLIGLVFLIFRFFTYIKRQDTRNKQAYVTVESLLKLQNDLLSKLIDSRLKVTELELNKEIDNSKTETVIEKEITLSEVMNTSKEDKPSSELSEFINNNIGNKTSLITSDQIIQVDPSLFLNSHTNKNQVEKMITSDGDFIEAYSYVNFYKRLKNLLSDEAFKKWSVWYNNKHKETFSLETHIEYFSENLLHNLYYAQDKVSFDSVCKIRLLNGHFCFDYDSVSLDRSNNNLKTETSTFNVFSQNVDNVSEIMKSIQASKGIISNLNNRRKVASRNQT